ncbi:GAF and ANTAR domain-containing protein [Nocardiopsis sp. HNM0947]|uniref:GAF and ANTAR domain-containing protein n=1 Tax=Nocardiopsis coralli TaxID=2772213 RepID=A0ABR9P9Z9_9ACTN|nr:GAF and ANTAR domain-containing protein [Nocardiopsis coralli]MBE3000676.1 GAF and ANTAR domain-containing protein [Nocardiopsis coralli]
MWANERREFSVAAREEDLYTREAGADAREAAADEREAEADAWLGANGLIDESEARAREARRAERELLRREREADRASRLSELAETVQEMSSGNTSDYPLAVRFAELSTLLFTAGSVGEVLDHLVLAAEEVIGGGDAVSVTLRRGDEFTTAAFRGDLARRLDHLQYELGEGPCLDSASTTGSAYAASADLGPETQWPRFARAAAGIGGGSVLSLGLFPDPSASLPRLGSLNFYAHDPHAFEPGDRDLGMLMAAHAGVALASTTRVTEAELRNSNLERALESRDVIGQAKGILMARQKLTPEQAFDKLREASNSLNTKLSEVARRLTETGESPLPR